MPLTYFPRKRPIFQNQFVPLYVFNILKDFLEGQLTEYPNLSLFALPNLPPVTCQSTPATPRYQVLTISPLYK